MPVINWSSSKLDMMVLHGWNHLSNLQVPRQRIEEQKIKVCNQQTTIEKIVTLGPFQIHLRLVLRLADDFAALSREYAFFSAFFAVRLAKSDIFFISSHPRPFISLDIGYWIHSTSTALSSLSLHFFRPGIHNDIENLAVKAQNRQNTGFSGFSGLPILPEVRLLQFWTAK